MLTQPTLPEGPYTLTTQPLPDPVWVARRKQPLTYGLFSYMRPYRKFREGVKAVGWRHLRMGGSIEPADMDVLAGDRMRLSVHLADGKKRNAYDSDEEFLRAAERRAEKRLAYYSGVRHFHVWNEPNGDYMLEGKESPEMLERRARLYAKLLLRISAIVRKQRPDAKILGFDCGRPGPNTVQFVELVYAAESGIHRAYDIMAVHPGVDPAPPECDLVKSYGSYSIAETVQGLRRIMRLQHSQKPVWWPEGGWHISKEDGGRFDEASDRTISPIFKAAYDVRYYALAIRLAVKCVTPFFIVDVGGQGNPPEGANGGFFDDDKVAPRLSADAIQVMIDILPRPRLHSVLRDGDGGVYAWRITPDINSRTPPVVMAWNVEGPKTVSFEFPDRASIQVTDMLGGKTVQQSLTGLYEIELGPLPVYLS